MADVDTLIDNAYMRALAWGGAADTAADAATKVPVFKPPKDDKAKTPPTISRVKPFASTKSEKGDKLAADFEANLDEFFDKLFPAGDSAYGWAAGWVIHTLSTGQTNRYSKLTGGACLQTGGRTNVGGGKLLPNSFGDAVTGIWNDAGLHIEAMGNDVDDLKAPAGRISGTHSMSAEMTLAETESLAKHRANLYQLAASSGLADMRERALKAVADYIKAKALLDTADSEMRILVERARNRFERTYIAWQTASVDATIESARRAMIAGDELVAMSEAKAKNVMDRVKIRVGAALAGADAMAVVAQAANASMNSVASSSQVGF